MPLYHGMTVTPTSPPRPHSALATKTRDESTEHKDQLNTFAVPAPPNIHTRGKIFLALRIWRYLTTCREFSFACTIVTFASLALNGWVLGISAHDEVHPAVS